MILHRGYRFRLYATPAQEALFAQFSGVCRLIYNLGLEQRRDWWRPFRNTTKTYITFASQCRELTLLRAEFEWIGAVSIIPQQQALRDLDRAFGNFFSGIAKYPTPRKRGEFDSFRFNGRECSWHRLNAKWAVVRLPKIGDVKFRLSRNIPGAVKNVTVTNDALGWHVVFGVEIEVAPLLPRPTMSVGIDRGVKHTLALSDGTFWDIDRERLKLLDRRARKHQRALARKKNLASRRRAATKRLLARTRATAARFRKHWHHERASEIARNFGVVIFEDLNIKGMTSSARGTIENPGRNVSQKAGLNRVILEQGWYQFETLVTYKVSALGGEVRKINPAFTSQTCSACGVIDKSSRENQAAFRCSHCGYSANADTNAAMNILRAGTQPAPRLAVGRSLKRKLKRVT